MRMTLLTAGAVLISLAMVVPAEARRHKAVDADQAESSDEQEARPAKRGHEARNFWDNDDEASERPARRSRRSRSVASEESIDEGDRPARRTRRQHDTESNDTDVSEVHSNGVGPRPGAWCGWYMRTQRGGGPELNLAANWMHWGSAASGPQVGAVVVWPHHVGEITGRSADGQWIVKSGNDSGRVRERPRSVSGAVFRVG